MSRLAPLLQAFFSERLLAERGASPHTVAAYRDTFCLLLGFVEKRSGKSPSKLLLADLDATTIGAFLAHLEAERGNSVRTRNARLAAIHSLFRFAARRHPEHAELIARVLDVPQKRFERAIVSFLTDEEVEALLSVPDTSSFLGRRDHALLFVLVQAGLRVSELVGLSCGDVLLGTGACLRCLGKGRKQRATPLTSATRQVLASWLTERQGEASDPLFCTRKGDALSRHGVATLVTKHAEQAKCSCPSLASKTVTPHVLRHTCAMRQ